MTEKASDRAGVILERLGECQGLTHYPGDPLPERVIAALEMIGSL